MAANRSRSRSLDSGPYDGARVADWIYGALREGILTGRLAPGDRLRQQELATQFDVSHSPVREAIARLASEGLVTVRPRRGAEVNALDPTEVAEIYEVRILLEPAALDLAFERAGIDGDKVLSGAQQSAAGASPSELFERNRAFHRQLYVGCGNRRMISILDSLWDSVTAMRMFEAYTADPDETARSNTEHLAIARVVAQGDRVEAVRLLDAHVRGARADLLAAMDEPEEMS